MLLMLLLMLLMSSQIILKMCNTLALLIVVTDLFDESLIKLLHWVHPKGFLTTVRIMDLDKYKMIMNLSSNIK